MIQFGSFSQSGAQHLFMMIELTQMLSPDVRNILYPLIQHNAFYTHTENILFLMINDDASNNRQIGWRRIKKAREQNKRKTVRPFKVSDLNFEASSYIEIIN